MEGGTHLVLSVFFNPYPQASARVPILRICLRVNTQQYSQSNTVLIIYCNCLSFSNLEECHLSIFNRGNEQLIPLLLEFCLVKHHKSPAIWHWNLIEASHRRGFTQIPSPECAAQNSYQLYFWRRGTLDLSVHRMKPETNHATAYSSSLG